MNLFYAQSWITALTGKLSAGQIFSFYDWLNVLKAAHVSGNSFTEYGGHSISPILVRLTAEDIESVIAANEFERRIVNDAEDVDIFLNQILSETLTTNTPKTLYDVCLDIHGWKLYEIHSDEENECGNDTCDDQFCDYGDNDD